MSFETRNRRLGPWDTLGPIINAINDLENTNVKCTWFESVASGTSGTITPPSGGTIVLDEWSAGVDVLVSGISSGVPDFKSVIDTEGAIITGTLDSAGAWTISGVPGDGYPISLIFVYRVALSDFNYAYCLESATVEGVNTLSLLGDLGNELSGFPDDYRDQSTIALNALDFTITPVGDKFSVWVLGKEFIYAAVETQVLDGTEGIHWIYFDSDGAIQVAVNPNETEEEDLIKRNALVAYVMLDDNDTHIVFADERHGLTMDGSTHFYLHELNGFSYYEGLTAGDITADGSGASNASATLSITNGTLFDEDMKYETSNSGQTLSTPAQIPVYYMDGVAGSWRKDTADNYPVKNFPADTLLLAYNSFSSPNYGQTECGNNAYVLCHIFAVNDIDEPIIAIQGQAVYATIILAREGAVTELMNLNTIGAPAQEFTPLYTLIFQTATAYSNDVQARIRTTDDGDDYIDWRTTQAGGGSGGGGAGDVTGPSSSTDNAIARFDLATGKVIQESAIILTDTGSLVIPDQNGLQDASLQPAIVINDADGPDIYFNGNIAISVLENGLWMYAQPSENEVYQAEGWYFADTGNALTWKNMTPGFTTIIEGIQALDASVFLIKADPDGAVELYHNGTKYFETGHDNATGEGIKLGSNAEGLWLMHDDTLGFGWIICREGELGLFIDADRQTSDPSLITLRVANDSGVLETGLIVNGFGATELYHSGVKTFETAAGQFILYNFDASESVIFYNETVVDATFEIRNLQHGGKVLLSAENTATGAIEPLFLGDPDGSSALYHGGIKTIETYQDLGESRGGLTIYDDEADKSHVILVLNSNGQTIFANQFAGGELQFGAVNDAEAWKVMCNMDPDGAVELFHAGIPAFQTVIDPLEANNVGFMTGTVGAKSCVWYLNTVDNWTFLRAYDVPFYIDADMNAADTPSSMHLRAVNDESEKHEGIVVNGTLREIQLYYDNVKSITTYTGGAAMFDSTGAQGVVTMQSNEFRVINTVKSGHVALKGQQDGEAWVYMFDGDPDGAASLYHNGVVQFQTINQSSVSGTSMHNNSGAALFFYAANDTATPNVWYINAAVESAHIIINSIASGGAVNHDLFVGDPDGTVELYYNGVKAFETRAAGIYVYSGADNGSLFVNSSVLTVKSYVESGHVKIQGINDAAATGTMLLADPDGAVELYFNGVKTLETTATGLKTIFANTWDKQQNSAIATLSSSSAAVAWNLTTGQSAKHTLSEDTTISAPSNMVDGGTYVIRITQAAGLYTLSWNAAFDWGESAAPEEPAANGDAIVVTFTSDGTNMLGVEFLREEA